MRTMNRTFATVALVALAGLMQGGTASAQLANASSRTLGLGDNSTATAQRFEAISVNPAGLGMPGAGFSLALLPVTARQGLGPITLKDLADQGGQVVSPTVKEQWLSKVAAQGQQAGSVGAEVSVLALTMGRFGFQLSAMGGGSMSLAPDIVEVALYGNAGRTGSPKDLTLTGSSLDGFAVTTAGFSLGLPIPSETGAMAFGATLKYSVGHLVAVGQDQGGSLKSDPIKVNVNFPTVSVDDENMGANQGSGIGVDVGFQIQRDRLHFGAAVLNAFNTFAWDESKLTYRAGLATLEQSNNTTDFDKKPYSSAPAALKASVEEMKFDPTVSVGAAYDVQPDFTLSADVRNRFGDGMSLTPKLHAGVGAEYRGLGALHFRGGLAVVTEGMLLGGGATLVLGPVNFSFAGAVQKSDLQDVNIGQFTLSFGGR